MQSRSAWYMMVLLTAIFLYTPTPAVQTPPFVSYQGRLADNNGLALTDTVKIVFSIYTTPGALTSIWTETHDTVAVLNGLFSVTLGSKTPLSASIFKDTDIGRYLGVAIDNNPELPRQEFLTVPYAFRIATVDGAAGGNIQGSLSVGNDNEVTNGLLAVGAFNQATGTQSVAVGGNENVANGSFASVFGGSSNTASGDHATVSGVGNQAGGGWSVVSGGAGNRANALYSTVAGGRFNEAIAFGSTVPGGENNDANGLYSLAAGFRAKANHQGAFVWADSTNSDFASTNQDQFLIRAGGGVGIGTNDPQAPLHVQEGESGGSFNANSIGAFERNVTAFLTVSTPSQYERGLLLGDETNSADGGIVYNNVGARNGMQLRTGGNQTRMVIDSLGNVGIGTVQPRRKLHLADGSSGDTIDAASLLALDSDDRYLITLNGPNDRERGIAFGYDTDPDAGRILFNQSFNRRGFNVQVQNILAMSVDSVGKVGLYTSSPSSRLEIQGSLALDPDVITGSTTLGEQQGVVVFETPVGTHTITLPLADTCPGRIYFLKVNGPNSGTINIVRSGTDLIDNMTTYTMTADYDFVQMVSDGEAKWLVISERP